jgi:hypothetical protein
MCARCVPAPSSFHFTPPPTSLSPSCIDFELQWGEVDQLLHSALKELPPKVADEQFHYLQVPSDQL